MESALAWIGQIAEWIGRFIPRLVIMPSNMGGVKYIGRFGSMRVEAMPPGLHVYWPLVTEVETYPTARQTDNLPTQTISTSDGKTVAIAGLATYEVADILMLLPTTFQPDKAISEITLTAIHDVASRMTWEELQSEQRRGTLETKLRNAARKQLEEYGVRVIRVQLTDLAPARVLKVIQSVTQDDRL
jgi:regulator of protease activity HflC (stomatin/prohibitin superfamily)